LKKLTTFSPLRVVPDNSGNYEPIYLVHDSDSLDSGKFGGARWDQAHSSSHGCHKIELQKQSSLFHFFAKGHGALPQGISHFIFHRSKLVDDFLIFSSVADCLLYCFCFVLFFS
jgi:hypothetical protein